MILLLLPTSLSCGVDPTNVVLPLAVDDEGAVVTPAGAAAAAPGETARAGVPAAAAAAGGYDC